MRYPRRDYLTSEGKTARCPETMLPAGLRVVMNRAAIDDLTDQEQNLLKRDEDTHQVQTVRFSDKDCAPLPLYIPSSDIPKNIFMAAVKKNVAAGMDFRSAWLKARNDNPVAFSAYLSSK